MLHHLSIGIADLQRSVSFYDAAFSPLGYHRLWTKPDGVGYGTSGLDEQFALKLEDPEIPVGSSKRSHIAIVADPEMRSSPSSMRLSKIGAGIWGSRHYDQTYGENYFAAFVCGPDGYKIEAVCTSLPEAEQSRS